MKFKQYLMTEKLPAGWDKSSVEKFAKSVGKDADEKGFFDA